MSITASFAKLILSYCHIYFHNQNVITRRQSKGKGTNSLSVAVHLVGLESNDRE